MTKPRMAMPVGKVWRARRDLYPVRNAFQKMTLPPKLRIIATRTVLDAHQIQFFKNVSVVVNLLTHGQTQFHRTAGLRADSRHL